MPHMIDIYIKTIKLWYIFLLKQKKQILKLKWQLTHALNIRKKYSQKQKKPVFDTYRNSLKDIIDNNIDNSIPGRNNFLWLLKLNALDFQSKKAVLFNFGFLIIVLS